MGGMLVDSFRPSNNLLFNLIQGFLIVAWKFTQNIYKDKRRRKYIILIIPFILQVHEASIGIGFHLPNQYRDKITYMFLRTILQRKPIKRESFKLLTSIKQRNQNKVSYWCWFPMRQRSKLSPVFTNFPLSTLTAEDFPRKNLASNKTPWPSRF